MEAQSRQVFATLILRFQDKIEKLCPYSVPGEATVPDLTEFGENLPSSLTEAVFKLTFPAVDVSGNKK